MQARPEGEPFAPTVEKDASQESLTSNRLQVGVRQIFWEAGFHHPRAHARGYAELEKTQ